MVVSLLERQQTFGASSLGNLRRGVTVPDIPANNAVPTGFPINLSSLAGAVKQSLSASVSPGSAFGSRTTAGNCVSNLVTCTPNGAIGAITYQWHVGTSSGNAISITAPNSSSTAFSAAVGAGNTESIGSAYCTITDQSTGATANTPTIPVDLMFNV